MKLGEIYFYYLGSYIILYMIYEDGRYEIKIIGDLLRDNKVRFYCYVLKNVWFVLEFEDKSGLCVFSEVVGLGFDYEDLEIGDSDKMIEMFLQYKEIIEKFCLKQILNVD